MTPKLAVGFTYDDNRNAGRTRGQNGSFITDESLISDLSTFFADLMFKYQGLSVMIEYVDKATEANLEFSPYYTGSSYNVAAGYILPCNLEFAVRYTDVKADVATDEKHYTFGLNKFFVGHKLKLQTDFSFIDRADNQNSVLWRTQVDIHF